VKSLLTALVRSLDKPVTAKIRCLQSDAETLEVAQAIQQTGVSMLTVHGRTAESKKAYTGPVDWDIITKIKRDLTIPVIANGGIRTRADALACLAYTGADGVMSSEGLLENPKLFSEAGSDAFETNYLETQLDTVDEYLHVLHAYPGKATATAHVARAHIFKILYRILDAPLNTDLRNRLGQCELAEIPLVVTELRQRLRTYIGTSGMESAQKDGLSGHTLWYMRHRDLRARQRIMSAPKWWMQTNAGRQQGEEQQLQQQQQLLKDRLLAQRALRLAESDPDTGKGVRTTSPMNYIYR